MAILSSTNRSERRLSPCNHVTFERGRHERYRPETGARMHPDFTIAEKSDPSTLDVLRTFLDFLSAAFSGRGSTHMSLAPIDVAWSSGRVSGDLDRS